MSTPTDPPALTSFSHGAGCGCKIAPQALQQILKGQVRQVNDPRLLVGNDTNDDAAAYDLGDGRALIATTDFFMPIVDDPFDFGRVAAANAVSDVYAMGGKPLVALSILGWPLEHLSAEMASRVVDGARQICHEAGIVLAGGHTIDNKEPLFGLAVNGLVPVENLKRNSTGRAGDLLLLTKPLGTGIFSTARKRKLLSPSDYEALVEQLCTLNAIGERLGTITGVNAMTDVTGFGLMGHVLEMAEGSGCGAELWYDHVPKMQNLGVYLGQQAVPDATFRNWNSYQKDVDFDPGVNVAEAFSVLPDPQTNGGLLIAVAPAALAEVQSLLAANGLQQYTEPVGKLVPQGGKRLLVKQAG